MRKRKLFNILNHVIIDQTFRESLFTNGQQTLWKDVAVTDSVLEITTDQNRLFVMYLFGDQAAAQAAPQVYP